MTDHAECIPNPLSNPSPIPSSSPSAPGTSADDTARPRRWPIQKSLPPAPPLEGLTPIEFLQQREAQMREEGWFDRNRQRRQETRQRSWDDGPYSLDRARVVMGEMANLLRFVRDRLEDHADRLPESPDREAQIAFEAPYELSTEMWQVAKEVEVHLSELIDRMDAAARVTQTELDAEFAELAEAAEAVAG